MVAITSYLRLCEAAQVGHSLPSVSERASGWVSGCVFVRTIARAHMKLECWNLTQIFILISSAAGHSHRSPRWYTRLPFILHVAHGFLSNRSQKVKVGKIFTEMLQNMEHCTTSNATRCLYIVMVNDLHTDVCLSSNMFWWHNNLQHLKLPS